MCLTLIVPVYNGERFIRKCLESIGKQTYQEYELLVVNDGSTDQTDARVASFFAAHPEVHGRQLRQENCGLLQARKAGIHAATGDWITFVDADDWIEPDHLQVLMRVLEQTGADVACSGFIKEIENHSNRTKRRVPVPIRKDKADRNGQHGPCGSAMWENTEAEAWSCNGQDAIRMVWERTGFYQYVWNKVFRKELFENTVFPQGSPIGEDFFLVMQALAGAEMVCAVNKETYHYRVHPKSITQRAEGSERWQGYALYRERREVWRTGFYSAGKPMGRKEQIGAEKALNRYLMLEYMACLLAQYRSGRRHVKEEKEILTFIREHRRDYIRNSHDGPGAKLFAMLANQYTSCIFFHVWPRRRFQWRTE